MYLNCHTALSFKYGTLQVKDLFEEAKRCGVHKLVLTEINNTASYIEMLRYCEENAPYKDGLTKFGKEAYKLDIAIGIEFRRDNELLYIIIAKNNKGFEMMNRFLSHHNMEKKSLPERAPEIEHTYVIYPFKKRELETLRGDEFIGIPVQDVNQLVLYDPYKT